MKDSEINSLPTHTEIDLYNNNDEEVINPESVILPPPELKTIIEKTVEFVAKNGIQFEEKLRKKQASNRKFDFLNDGNPYYLYYKWKIQCKNNPKAMQLAEEWEKKQKEYEKQQSDIIRAKELEKAKKSVKVVELTLKQRIEQELKLSKKPKEEFVRPPKSSKYQVPQPSLITPYELDIMKLTAQFTAANGKSFIREILNEEPNNETFAFLSPINSRFQYFQRLVDAYKTILDNYEHHLEYISSSSNNNNNSNNNSNITSPFMNKELKINLNRDKIWNECTGSAEYALREKRKQQEHAEAEDAERLANALIDWQSFIILETIDFDPINDTFVPPGKDIYEINSILDTEEIENIEPILAHDDDMDMVMSESEDEGESDDKKDKNINKSLNPTNIPTAASTMSSGAMSFSTAAAIAASNKEDYNKTSKRIISRPQGIIISPFEIDKIPRLETEEDFDLRMKLEKLLKDSRIESTNTQKCPVCNEYVSITHLSDHIRIELLDPKWKEQKETLKVRMSQTSLASNEQVASNLTKFSQQHAEQFNIDNQNKNDDNNNNSILTEPVQWDGHADTLAASKALKAVQDELEKVKQQQEKEKKQQEKLKQQQQQQQQQQLPQPQPQPQSQSQLQPQLQMQSQSQLQTPQTQQLQSQSLQSLSQPPIMQPPSLTQPNALSQMFINQFAPRMIPGYPNFASNPFILQSQQQSFQPPPPSGPPPLQQRHIPPAPPGVPPIRQYLSNIPPPPPGPPPSASTTTSILAPTTSTSILIPSSSSSSSSSLSIPIPISTPITTTNIFNINDNDNNNDGDDDDEDSPPKKKQKILDGSGQITKIQPNGLIPENEFIEQNQGPIKVRIVIPKDETKTQLAFKGQILTFTMSVTDQIQTLRERLESVVLLPSNRQKLKIQSSGIFLKDGTLAFYNISNGNVLELSERTRGGKGKKTK